MHIEDLHLKDFRNYRNADARFSEGLNMIIGANGQGKTNLLEAVHVLCGVGSHRAASQASLIRHGVEVAIVRGRCRVKERQIRVDAEIRASGGLRLKANGNPVEGSGQLSVLPASVVFAPDDLALVKGGPEERRRYLDDIAGQIKPLAAAQKAEFDKTLRQRNGVLKAAQMSSRAKVQLEVWTHQLAVSAAKVLSNRLEVLRVVSGSVAEKYPSVAGHPASVHVDYRASWAEGVPATGPAELEQMMSRALAASVPRDLERGVTLVGPHRDDIEIQLDGAPARIFASQGEQRSLALSLRLAEHDLVADARRELPILLLDDVFSELDENRRRRVAEVVESGGQSFLTTTEPEALPMTAETVVRVVEGTLLPSG